LEPRGRGLGIVSCSCALTCAGGTLAGAVRGRKGRIAPCPWRTRKVDPFPRFPDAAPSRTTANRGPQVSETASPPAEEGAAQVPAVREAAAAREATASRASSHALPTSGPCLNCRTLLTGHFCATCGQKVVAPNPTLHDLWHEFTHEMLHVDGRLFRSVKLLFVRPGFLTREYCAGRRARYLAPLRLYLIFSILFFALEAYFPPPTTVYQDPKLGQVASTAGLRVSGDRLLRNRTPEQIVELFQGAQHNWVPRLMFVLVPLAALLLMAFTRREKRHFPEHMYFALHLHAAFFGAFLLAHLVRLLRQPALGPWIALYDVLFVVLYTAIAIHTFYGGTWLRAAVRTGGLLIFYWIILVVLILALFVVVLLL
jgi:hypothetical protein